MDDHPPVGPHAFSVMTDPPRRLIVMTGGPGARQVAVLVALDALQVTRADPPGFSYWPGSCQRPARGKLEGRASGRSTPQIGLGACRFPALAIARGLRHALVLFCGGYFA
jgi:hypothetical protein